MDEHPKDKASSAPLWAYLIAAVVGSLVGAILDATLYPDGGSMLMKIGFVVGPLGLYLVRRGRAKDAE